VKANLYKIRPSQPETVVDIAGVDDETAPDVVTWRGRTFLRTYFTPGKPGELTYREVEVHEVGSD
jgi:hypothetical protein